MVPGITGSRRKWLAKTQAIEDNSFLATAYPRPNLPPSMLISIILSNASSGGLGSFGVFSPNKVPSLQRINSERRNERFSIFGSELFQRQLRMILTRRIKDGLTSAGRRKHR